MEQVSSYVLFSLWFFSLSYTEGESSQIVMNQRYIMRLSEAKEKKRIGHGSQAFAYFLNTTQETLENKYLAMETLGQK